MEMHTVTEEHATADASKVFQALTIIKLHFLAVIVEVCFPLPCL